MIDPRPTNRAARRRAGRGKRRTTLASLSAAAMSLFGAPDPGWSDSPAEEPSMAYSFAFYDERPLAEYKLASGSRDRYEVQSHNVSGSGPIGERIEIGANLVYESMSGSTPWYVVPGSDPGTLLQAMTGATVSDERVDVSANGSYFFDNGRVGALVGVSHENDYLAVYAGLNGETHVNDSNTTLSAGLSFSIDELTPTGGGTGGRVVKADKNSVTTTAGFSQVLGRRTNFQSTLTYRWSSGFLSDPYKLAWIDQTGGFTVNDSRPDVRNQIALLNQLRNHVEPIDASIHLDYQFYWDDWDITSHTIEFRWYQSLFADRLQLIPNFRYYSQGSPFFYEPVYFSPRQDGLASSDYRLSPFGAMSYGLRAQFMMEDWPWDLDWRLAASYERYVSGGSLALGTVQQVNPGLVDFNLYYFTLDVKF